MGGKRTQTLSGHGVGDGFVDGSVERSDEDPQNPDCRCCRSMIHWGHQAGLQHRLYVIPAPVWGLVPPMAAVG